MEIGEERTAVEMAKGPLFSVVVDGEDLIALRASEAGESGVFSPHVDPATLDGQLHRAHLPWSDESQQVPVEFSLTHGPIVAVSSGERQRTPVP